jgi:hypothetical protein
LENCYRNGHGYCCERTAWIHHLLALDLWKRGRTKKDRGLLEHALKHTEAALIYFPRGFIQHTSTLCMRDAVERMLVKLESGCLHTQPAAARPRKRRKAECPRAPFDGI